VSAQAVSESQVRELVSRCEVLLSRLSSNMLLHGLFFQWYVLYKIPVYLDIKSKHAIAYVDDTALYVTPEFLKRPFEHQLFILLHELYHLALRHSELAGAAVAKQDTTYKRNVAKIVHNIITDAIVNKLIYEEYKRLGLDTRVLEGYVKYDKISKLVEADLLAIGTENAIEKVVYMVLKGDIELKVTFQGIPVDISSDKLEKLIKRYGVLIARLRNRRNGEELVVEIVADVLGGAGASNKRGVGEEDEEEEGDGSSRVRPIEVKKPAGGKYPKSAEDLSRIAREAAEFAAQNMERFRKEAGRGVAGGYAYMLDDATPKRPEWEVKLLGTLERFLSSNAVVSWSFVNRSAPLEKPGIRYIRDPEIWILLDVSGSMLDGNLGEALKRVIYIAERYNDVRVRLIQWSGAASLPVEVDRKFAADVKKYKKLEINTGGTELGPALDMLLKHTKNRIGDYAVVILTDGYIYDIEEKSVMEKLAAVARRAGAVVFASTGYIPENLPDNIVKARIETPRARQQPA